MHLVQLTDTHLPGKPGGSVRGVRTDETLARCRAPARPRHPAAGALLLTGDLVQDAAGGYEILRAMLADSPVPVHCIGGNHDLPGPMREALGQPPFVLDPVVTYGPWLLVMLDTMVPGAVHGHLAEPQLALLDEALSRHAGLHALICLHHQPVKQGSRWLDAVMLDNPEALFAVLARHDSVRGLLWGHVHQAMDARRDGMLLMSTPSTCVQFLPGADQFALDTRPPGYRWLTLQPDGSILTGLEWVDGDD